jgi:hypothetical protein
MAAGNITIPSTFTPVKQLSRVDADVTLMMLNQNGVAYLKHSDDLWMPAHRTYPESPGFFFGDFDANLLGCIDQYQICNPQLSNKSRACTSLTSSSLIIPELLTRKNEVGLNSDQIATMGRFLGMSVNRLMFSSVDGRGQTALNGKLMISQKIQIIYN